MKITTANLSKEDIKLLKSDNPTNYFVLLVALGLIFLLIYNICYPEPALSKQEWNDILILILAGLFLGALLVYLLSSIIKTQKEIASNQKEILVGILTDKNNYYFYLDEQKIAIKDIDSRLKRYGGYHDNIGEIGQIIAIERSIYTKIILKIDVLNETE